MNIKEDIDEDTAKKVFGSANNAKRYLFNKSVKGARVERKAVKRGIDKDRSYILWWAYN